MYPLMTTKPNQKPLPLEAFDEDIKGLTIMEFTHTAERNKNVRLQLCHEPFPFHNEAVAHRPRLRQPSLRSVNVRRRLASLEKRTCALIVDSLFISLLAFAMSTIAIRVFGVRGWSLLFDVYLFTLVVTYFASMQFNDGQTIGQKFMSIKTVDRISGRTPDLGQVLVREMIGRWISLIVAIPHLIPKLIGARSSASKSFHDLISDTAVIELDHQEMRAPVSVARHPSRLQRAIRR